MSSVYTTHTTLHGKEERMPIQVRMRRSIHNAVVRYCGAAGINIGKFYESSVIQMMMLEPVEFTPLLVIKPEPRENNLDDQIEEVILIDELQEVVKLLPPEKKLHVLHKKKLAKLLKRCQKLNQRGDPLEKLMKEVISRLV